MSHFLPKRAESPSKQQPQQQQQQPPFLPAKPVDQYVDNRPADMVPPRAALTRRTSSRGATVQQQGPPRRPAGAREARELPDISKSMDSTKEITPTNPAEHVILLKSEQDESRKRIQDLEAQLASERDLREDLLANLERVQNQAEENRKLWKQTARELRKATQTQGTYQVTDSQLISSIQQLKYSIRNFAIQYFTGINGPRLHRDHFDAWVSPATLGTRAYVDYIRSPSRCSSIIQAILWRILVKRIFDQFLWAGRAGDSFCGLRFYLKLASRTEPNPDIEIERKFQMWSADTTSLMLQMGDFEEGTEDYHIFHNNLKSIRNEFWDLTGQFLVTRGPGPARELRRIIDDAISLDKQIHRQAARIKWELLEEGPTAYNPNEMEAEQGQERPSPNKQVLLAVAPGVKKQGKSDGQDFEKEQLLVPIEVSCQLPADLPSVVSETSYRILGFKFSA
ncbi:hypothetical protein BJY01DRAFT_242727 [Aspergillus pseudoustus]|uniref:Uncharacterized protein n=1 Tax=Aspergillus pseudoustus TaxID=1810923 RepID=A0ABR4KWM7_9EURO